MTHITCRLTAKNRYQLGNPTLGNRVRASFLNTQYGLSSLAVVVAIFTICSLTRDRLWCLVSLSGVERPIRNSLYVPRPSLAANVRRLGSFLASPDDNASVTAVTGVGTTSDDAQYPPVERHISISTRIGVGFCEHLSTHMFL